MQQLEISGFVWITLVTLNAEYQFPSSDSVVGVETESVFNSNSLGGQPVMSGLDRIYQHVERQSRG